MELKWKSCLRAGVTVIILFLMIHYWTAFTKLAGVAFGAAVPLLLGCGIAYVVNILMTLFEQRIVMKSKKTLIKRFGRLISMVLAFISIICIAVLIVQMIVPELFHCLQILLEELPKALQTAFSWLEENFHISSFLENDSNLLLNSEAQWQDMIKKALDIFFAGLGGVMDVAANIISSIVSTAVTVLVAVIFSIYLLLGKEKIGGQILLLMKSYLPGKVTDGILYVLHVLDQSFHSFIVGQCTEAVILGLLCMTGMLLLQLPYAAMTGCLVGFTALIPVAGAYIGAIVGAFMIFTVSPIKAVIFLVFLGILQQLEGNLIYPRVVGSSIGLPGIWVLAAVTIGGGVMGIGGMLLGVPLTAAVYQLVKNDIAKR